MTRIGLATLCFLVASFRGAGILPAQTPQDPAAVPPPGINHIGFTGGVIDRQLPLFLESDHLRHHLLAPGQKFDQLMVKVIDLVTQAVKLRQFPIFIFTHLQARPLSHRVVTR